MIRVNIRREEDLAKALKRLKRLCEKEGIIREYRKHQFYESPSEKRRRQKRAAIRRRQKEEKEERTIQNRKKEGDSTPSFDAFDAF